MPEFVEKNLSGNYRKQIGRKTSGSYTDIPVILHTLKTESSTSISDDDIEEH